MAKRSREPEGGKVFAERRGGCKFDGKRGKVLQ